MNSEDIFDLPYKEAKKHLEGEALVIEMISAWVGNPYFTLAEDLKLLIKGTLPDSDKESLVIRRLIRKSRAVHNNPERLYRVSSDANNHKGKDIDSWTSDPDSVYELASVDSSYEYILTCLVPNDRIILSYRVLPELFRSDEKEVIINSIGLKSELYKEITEEDFDF